MKIKWVDIQHYFGPDRRQRGLGKRWGDRRRDDAAGQPPPLGAALRRLRVLLLDVSAPEERARAVQLAHYAAEQAEGRRLIQCAAAARQAALYIADGDTAAAERALMDAQASLDATG